MLDLRYTKDFIWTMFKALPHVETFMYVDRCDIVSIASIAACNMVNYTSLRDRFMKSRHLFCSGNGKNDRHEK